MPLVTIEGLVLIAAIALFVAYCTCTIIRARQAQRPPAVNDKKTNAVKALNALSILYETGQQNLVSFKDNQWSIMNYSLLGIAAIVAAFTILSPTHVLGNWVKYISVFLVALIGGFGSVLITDLQFGIVAHRVALNQMKLSLFNDDLPGYSKPSADTICKDRKFFRNVQLPMLFYTSILIGGTAAILIIINK
ncbi:MAG: hypothetical protein FVQ80_14180 [Planctomycetes bacterium]|nr:hypothetical protein [Planctomycetota bacterium]